jgi:hypothetical protein
MNETMKNQGVDPAEHPHLKDIFTHLAFGGSIKADGLTGGGLALSGSSLKKVDVQVTLLTLPDADSPTAWTTEVAKIRPAPPGPHRTAPHRTALHRTAPHRTAPHRTAPHRTAPHRTAPPRA